MKAAVYVQDMRASGVVRCMLALARHLSAAGDEATVVAGYADGHFTAADALPAGFTAARDRPGRRPRLAVVAPLRRTLRQLAPDVIVSGGNFGHFSLWAAALRLGIPVVYVFSNPATRTGQRWRNRWRRFWTGTLLRHGAGAILVGRVFADDPVFAEALAAGTAVIIANGVELDRAVATPGPPPPLMAGLPPIVLAIGRLQPQKNFGALIDAVAEAGRTMPLRLVILGTGTADAAHALTEHAAARGIADRFTLAGVTDDVFAWLRAARVFALPSRWEGSSIALLEAMAAGTPVVASTAAGDAPDVLDGGRYGLLADPDDVAAFAVALLRQAGPDPVLPGDRAFAYDAGVVFDRYRALLLGVSRPA